jgi:hydrogenase-4 component E
MSAVSTAPAVLASMPGVFAAHLPPLVSSIFSLLAIISLLLAFVMLGSRWLHEYLIAFMAQSWLIAVLSAAVGFYGHYPELYGIAAFTALFRGLVLPYLLLRITRRLQVDREIHERLAPSSSLVVGALLVVFAFAVATHLGEALGLDGTVAVLALTVMLSMKLIGFLMLTVRSEVISQILGLLVLENGIFLGSQILVPGMPLLIELVILFDLLVVVACFGVLVRYLVVHAGTSSTLQLRRLTG